MMEVITPTGIPVDVTTLEMLSQTISIIAPITADEGIRCLMSEPMSLRAM